VEPQTLSRAARDAFRDILGDPALGGRDLASVIEGAGARLGVEPFSACLAILSVPPRDETEARQTFEAIEAHRVDLTRHLGRDPGLPVAAADYLQVTEGQAWRTSLRLSRRTRAADPREGALDETLAAELRRCARLGRALGLVLLAPEGGPLDEAAESRAGAALREAVRDVDRVVRLLPAGYAVVLPCTPGGEAVRAAARLRAVAGRAAGRCWSAGVAAVPGVRPDAEALAASARAALSLARRGGAGAVCQGEGDRRRARRRAVGPSLAAAVAAGGRRLPVAVEDLSPCGALVRIDREIGTGTRVTLTLRETTPRPRVEAIPGRIVRLVPAAAPRQAGESWRAAVAFEPRADLGRRVADLIAALPPPPSGTARR
jgi:hypothetical protein